MSRSTTRRELLLALGALAALPAAATSPSSPPRALRIGSVLDGADGADGEARGVRLGAEEAERLGALLRVRFEIVPVSAGPCGAPAPPAAAAGLAAAVGGGGASCRAALRELASRGELAVVLTRPDEELAEPGPAAGPAFSVAPSPEMATAALARGLPAERKLRRWHFVTAPEARGEALRRLAAAELAAAGGEEVGHTLLEPGREGDGVEAVREAVARTRPDVLFLCLGRTRRDALLQALGPVAPGTAVSGAVAAPSPGWWAEAWDPGLFRYGAGELNERHERRLGAPMDGAAWCGWVAVKALAEAALRAAPGEPGALAASLERLRMDGHKGMPLTFRAADRRLRQPFYLVHKAGDGRSEVIAEVPPRAEAEPSWNELFDRRFPPPAPQEAP